MSREEWKAQTEELWLQYKDLELRRKALCDHATANGQREADIYEELSKLTAQKLDLLQQIGDLQRRIVVLQRELRDGMTDLEVID